jgi:hypothetical protein
MRRVALLSVFVALAAFASAAEAAPRNTCRPKQLETVVSGIKLGTEPVSARTIGRNHRPVEIQPMTDFPWTVFPAQDGKQTIALMSHPGGTLDSFAELEVKERDLGKRDYLGESLPYYVEREPGNAALAIRTFTTPLGIRLGVSRTFVTSRLGACDRTYQARGDMRTIRYEVTDEKSPLLKGTDYPSYYAEYQFRRDKLVRFRFGFDYP